MDKKIVRNLHKKKLISYVKSSLEKGFSKDVIELKLIQSNVNQKLIDEVFKEVKVKKKPKINPKIVIVSVAIVFILLSVILGYMFLFDEEQIEEVDLPEDFVSEEEVNQSFELYQKGIEYYHNYDKNKSIELIKQAIEIYPGNADYHTYLGDVYLEVSLFDQAQQAYENALEVDSNQIFAVNGMGMAYMYLAEYDKAETYILKSIEIYELNNSVFEKSTDGVDLYITLGRLYERMGEYDKAEETFNRAMEIDENEPGVYTQLGNLYFVKKEYDKSIEYINKAIELGPKELWAHITLARIYLAQDDLENAEFYFKKVLSINNKSSPAPYNGLGIVYYKQSKFEEAKPYLLKSIDLRPHVNYENYGSLAKIYIYEGKMEEAKELLLKSLENEPNYTEASDILQSIEDGTISAGHDFLT